MVLMNYLVVIIDINGFKTLTKRNFLFYIFKNKKLFNFIKIFPSNIWILIENILNSNFKDKGVSLSSR